MRHLNLILTTVALGMGALLVHCADTTPPPQAPSTTSATSDPATASPHQGVGAPYGTPGSTGGGASGTSSSNPGSAPTSAPPGSLPPPSNAPH
jgi:hypothetical protein